MFSIRTTIKQTAKVRRTNPLINVPVNAHREGLASNRILSVAVSFAGRPESDADSAAPVLGLSVVRNSAQYRHLTAAARIVSEQNGHFFVFEAVICIYYISAKPKDFL